MTPLTNDMLADIRSRINPAYRDTPGTESHERALLVGEIERLRGERTVLADLLSSSIGVLRTIEPASSEEGDELDALINAAKGAVEAVQRDSITQSTQAGGNDAL